MRRYAIEDEQRVRLLDLVRDWADSGLLDEAQARSMTAELDVDLRRTNPFLRAGLALFTAIIISAFVGLIAVSLELRTPAAIGLLTMAGAIGCALLADVLAGRYRLYRFGIEEAFAVAAVVLLCIGERELGPPRLLALTLLVGACGGAALYLRYGFIYAAIASVGCLALIPFQLDLSGSIQRSLAALVCGAVCIVARGGRLKWGDDFPGDEYGDLQAAALAGVYLAVNVQVAPIPHGLSGGFYWFTYVMIWILPAAGLSLGIRDRDRILIDISVVMALLTLVTSKPYLGWARNAWDPIVLGVLLIAGAIGLRRWLQHGPGEERYGFTAAWILGKDRRARANLGLASAALPIHPAAPSTAAPPTEFGGGRSGGGGAGGSF